MKRTRAKVAKLPQKGYTVVQMWECEFRDYCKSHPKIYAIRDECRPTFRQKHRGKVSEAQILNAVRTGHLFGIVECDISSIKIINPRPSLTDLTDPFKMAVIKKSGKLLPHNHDGFLTDPLIQSGKFYRRPSLTDSDGSAHNDGSWKTGLGL